MSRWDEDDERWKLEQAARGKPCPFKVGDPIEWINKSTSGINGHPVPLGIIPGVITETYDDVPTETDFMVQIARRSVGLSPDMDKDPWRVTVEWTLPDGHKIVQLARPEDEGTHWRRPK